jgi:C4-dicarboxylate-specific signal transduction histidine kinase
VAGAMSASLAHELNQPIGASRINLFMLKKLIVDKSISDQELHDVISRIEFDNQRSSNIIASLRAIFTQAPQSMEKVNLLAIVESTVGLVVGECKKHQIELKINIPTELEVKISRVGLQQVLLNLLNNAIDALKEIPLNPQRRIFILAKTLDNYAQITLQDNGPGISEHFCDQLFELFSAQKQSGLGVGLWLCRYILERSNGTITYEPNLSGGSQFFLNIPRWGDIG